MSRQENTIPYDCLRLGEVRPLGWMREQMIGDLHDGFAGHLDGLTPRAASGIFTKNRVRSFETTEAGMIHDTPRTWWNGLLRLAYLSGHRRNSKCEKTQEGVISDISRLDFFSHSSTLFLMGGKNNAESIFAVHKIPTDTHIRTLLDPIPPNL